MTNTKMRWRRRLCMLFCVILIFTLALPLTAHAETAVVTTGTMYSYFQTFGSNGVWKDIQTPSHWITSTGEVAYCLQTSMDPPYNSSYSTVDGSYYYSDYVLTGLLAIVQNGYPSTNAGFTDEQARYATANAIRFFLAENYCDGVPQYLNLNVNGDWIRGKSGYEDLYEWALYLVELAEWGAANPGSSGSLTFSTSSLALIEDSGGQYFTGNIRVNKNISDPYGLAYSLPNGTVINGYTGDRTETLTIKVPTRYENGSYTLCAYGTHTGAQAKLFFWAPSQTNQQRVMTYVLENTDDYLEAYATITTPLASPKVGSIQITKTDDSGNPLSGVSFELYDEYGNLEGSGQTNSSGILTFSNLELGTYYYKETATLSGYILDSSYHEVSVTENGQVARVTVRNSRATGNVVVTKTDSTDGDTLANAHFTLTNSSGQIVAQGDTGMDGRVIFEGIPLGSYSLRETVAPNGYVLDNSPQQITITAAGQTVYATIENDPAVATIVINKTDADSGAALSGVTFDLYNSSGIRIGEGTTGSDGKITFAGLLLGTYSVVETETKPGYVLDSTPISATLTSVGQTVTKNVTNRKALASIVVNKTDAESGEALSGVHFVLSDSSGAVVDGGGTDDNGRLSFSNLPLGSYTLTETETRNGYILDETPISIVLNTAGQTVTKSITNVPARGSVSISKTDSETGDPLQGVHFELRDEAGALCAEGDTGADGTLTLPNIPVGYYTLRESETLTGYVLDETARDVHISENGQTVQIAVQNDPIHSTLEITKKDAHEDTVLMGAGYRLYDRSGMQVAEGYTDASGKLAFPDLARGQYSYSEFKAPKGYLPDDTCYPVTITENGMTVTETRTNERRPGTLVVTKQKADGSPLEGAAFLLEYSTDQGATWQPSFFRVGDELTRGGCTTQGLDGGELTTGPDGKATFTGLRADGLILYRLTETKAPPGMTLMGDSILVGTLPVESGNIYAEDSEVFDTKAFHYTLNITATDDAQYRLPEAGGTGLVLLPVAMMLSAIPMIFTIKSKSKKEKTE